MVAVYGLLHGGGGCASMVGGGRSSFESSGLRHPHSAEVDPKTFPNQCINQVEQETQGLLPRGMVCVCRVCVCACVLTVYI